MPPASTQPAPARRPLPSDTACTAWTVVAHLSAGPVVSPMTGQREATRLFDRLRRVSPFVRIELFCAGRCIELHSPAVTRAADA